MSYAYNDGSGREIWEIENSPKKLSKDDQRLLDEGKLYRDNTRWSSLFGTRPELTLEDKNAGAYWDQVGVRLVERPKFHKNASGYRQPAFHRMEEVEVPIWQKIGGSGASGENEEDRSIFLPRWDADAGLEALRNSYDPKASAAGSISFNSSGDALGDAAAYGNAATEDFANRFVPGLDQQARLEAAEIGHTGRFHLSRADFSPPELGDPKDLFNEYWTKINEKKKK